MFGGIKTYRTFAKQNTQTMVHYFITHPFWLKALFIYACIITWLIVIAGIYALVTISRKDDTDDIDHDSIYGC